MANVKEITVPDIGGADAVEVIEVLVAPGDTVETDDSLITLESDKASMEIPAPSNGKIIDIKTKVGDKVSENSLILTMETGTASNSENTESSEKTAASQTTTAPTTTSSDASSVTITVPDIGDFDAIPVIEVLVAVGDTIAEEDSLLTLESDKASMDIPSTHAGAITEILVKAGDKVSKDTPIVVLETTETASTKTAMDSKVDNTPAPTPTAAAAAAPEPKPSAAKPTPFPMQVDETRFKKAHASPAIRRFARELGVDLGLVQGTGNKNRILKQDVQQFVKNALAGGASTTSGGGLQVAELPDIDFSAFGEIETQELTKINKLTGSNLHRSWVQVPHVTQFDEADITNLEEFRKQLGAEYKEKGIKITLIAFLLKAVAACLKEFPRFNASLDKSGDNLILKKYYHVGVAVDTPAGLMVPVIRDVDKKSIVELAGDVIDVATRAKQKKISPKEMQGGCFTISSLGGVGGTAFTPIVNQPEVAILGLSRSSMKPVYQDGEFVPRLMLPLSLSYDHRVIDGVAAAKFTTYMAKLLSDSRRLLL